MERGAVPATHATHVHVHLGARRPVPEFGLDIVVRSVILLNVEHPRCLPTLSKTHFEQLWLILRIAPFQTLPGRNYFKLVANLPL